MKNISILGSTGSIGKQTLEIVREHSDIFNVVALSTNKNCNLLLEQIDEFQPEIAVATDAEDAAWLKLHAKARTKIYSGMDGLVAAASLSSADVVLNALVGSIGLVPSCKVVEAGKTLALANKESLVVGGELIMNIAKKHEVDVLPVDSEHSAIFQCLRGENRNSLTSVILTASGGPFRNLSKKEIESSHPSKALKHPNWSMGQKITVDSATMMNKGLEVIEAKWLFGLKAEQIKVLVHPESIIHSMVEFSDTSVIAQLGLPDMRVPIQFALTYPERICLTTNKLDLASISKLNFEKVDTDRFPNLQLAFDAMEKGGTMPCVLNTANEKLVPLYIEGAVSFYQMTEIINKTMSLHQAFNYTSIQELQEIETWVKRQISEYI
ncbi:1-deoxy-D-xylulose 5-phosphate reductoisomerase [Tindallia californiensis]|uniref:1-deoxy-D-xylulose 5-phosphate reductoisomerase n=1 Tax=Tindallia californiensis TaxID=159292 RepID=A0A1H3NPR4_9FIRM|nr:1-deoxy-D-xylulose-5-phosphate reductoisomerase [Tindallia californiensis]SDY90788.1 1-deoxy-D-xylulose 5-phosphate reductoisomerase [Tindallia californiensis]